MIMGKKLANHVITRVLHVMMASKTIVQVVRRHKNDF
jgi:hypothetical protein